VDSFAKYAHIDPFFYASAIASEIVFPFISTWNTLASYYHGFPISNLACLNFVFLGLGGANVREQ